MSKGFERLNMVGWGIGDAPADADRALEFNRNREQRLTQNVRLELQEKILLQSLQNQLAARVIAKLKECNALLRLDQYKRACLVRPYTRTTRQWIATR